MTPEGADAAAGADFVGGLEAARFDLGSVGNRTEERGGDGEEGLDARGREEAVVADFSEAGGEDVEEEPADEFLGGDGDGISAARAEGDRVVSDLEEA